MLLDDDWPILADSHVHHVGEPVALVTAPTKEAARAALEAFEVEYEPLDPILELDQAAGEPPIYELNLVQGDVERALHEADLVVDGTFATGHQEHIYIECQALTAWFEQDGGIVVKGSMQCPYFVHKSLRHALELPDDKVRVIATAVGGGFGGKEDYPSLLALHAALLARACGRPVRIAYDRHEDIIATLRDPVAGRSLSGGPPCDRPLPLPERQDTRACPENPYRHQRCLSRLRSAASTVRHRAPDGSRRARAGPGPSGDSTAQRSRSG
jgi:xanthine dehydrogenase molybdopterin-binding subunit B